MTLLQRGVIERLREAGFSALADVARHEWMQDKAIQDVESIAVGEPHGQLRADLVIANKHAGRGTD
jgi:hypothetical protein